MQPQKYLRLLHTPKGQQQYGKFLVEGHKGVQAALQSDFKVVQIYASPKEAANYSGKAVTIIQDHDWPKISNLPTPPGVMAEVQIQPATQATPSGTVLIGCAINDPGNLGTIIRTADWFGVKQLWLTPGSVDPYNEKVIRSSMGSFFRVEIRTLTDPVSALQFLSQAGYQIVESKAGADNHTWPQGQIALLLGSESHGVPTNLATLANQQISIQGLGPVESLNLGVACGILLYSHARFLELL